MDATLAAPRWTSATRGLYVVAVAFVVQLCISLGTHLLVALTSMALWRSSVFSGHTEWLFWGSSFLSLGVGAALLVGLALMLRDATPANGLVTAAVVLFASDLVLSAVQLAIEVAVPKISTSGIVEIAWDVDLVLVIGAEALLFEAMLRLWRAARGGDLPMAAAARVVFWATLLPRMLLSRVLHAFDVHPDGFAYSGLRICLTVLYFGLLIFVARSAAVALERGSTGSAIAHAPASKGDRAAGLRNVLLGMLWILLGGGVTVWTLAEGGGRYVVAYGAIVAGFVQLIRGVVQLARD